MSASLGIAPACSIGSSLGIGHTLSAFSATVRDGGRVAYPNGVMPLPKARSELRLQSYDVMPNAQLFKKLNQLIESGPFEVHVARTFHLNKPLRHTVRSTSTTLAN